MYTLTRGQPKVQLYGSAEDRRRRGEIASAYTAVMVHRSLRWKPTRNSRPSHEQQMIVAAQDVFDAEHVWLVLRRWSWFERYRTPALYGIGSLAAYWSWLRVAAILG